MLPTRSLPDPLLPLLPLRPQTPFARPDTAFTCSETEVGISRGRYSACRADPGLPLSFVFLCPPRGSHCAGLPECSLLRCGSASLPGRRIRSELDQEQLKPGAGGRANSKSA